MKSAANFNFLVDYPGIFATFRFEGFLKAGILIAAVFVLTSPVRISSSLSSSTSELPSEIESPLAIDLRAYCSYEGLDSIEL